MSLNPVMRELTALVVGIGCGIGIFLGLELDWYLAAGLGLASWGGMRFFFSSEKPKEVAPGILEEVYNCILEQANTTSKAIRDLLKSFPATGMNAHIEEMAAVIDRIRARVIEDPSCTKTVGNFLEFEVKAVVPILAHYLEFAARPNKSPEVAQQLRRQEKVIPLIKKKMDEQYQMLLKNDLMNLEASLGGLAGRLGIDEWDLDQLDQGPKS